MARSLILIPTVTQGHKSASVVVPVGLDEHHQQVVTLGDPSTDRLAEVLEGAPSATTKGLAVRLAGGLVDALGNPLSSDAVAGAAIKRVNTQGMIVDDQDHILKIVKDGDLFNASHHGVYIFGKSDDAQQPKARPFKVDDAGHGYQHLLTVGNTAMGRAGAGNADAETQRVTLATNDAAIAALITELQYGGPLGKRFSLGHLRHVGATITSGLGSTQSFRLGVPANNTKHVLLMRAYIASSVAATFSLNKGGTLTAPTSHTPWNPNFAFADTTTAAAQSLVGAITGGAALAGSIRVAADITAAYDLSILLPAGVGSAQSICMSATFGAGASSYVNVVYAEFDP